MSMLARARFFLVNFFLSFTRKYSPEHARSGYSSVASHSGLRPVPGLHPLGSKMGGGGSLGVRSTAIFGGNAVTDLSTTTVTTADYVRRPP